MSGCSLGFLKMARDGSKQSLGMVKSSGEREAHRCICMHVHAVYACMYRQQHQQQGEDISAILAVDKKAFAIMPMGMLCSMLILNSRN